MSTSKAMPPLSNLRLVSDEEVAISLERLIDSVVMEVTAQRSPLQPQQVNESNDEALGIDSLPNEIIEKIFSHLSQNQLGEIARVCRRWSILTKSPVLWREVNVEILCSSDRERDAQSFKSFIDRLPYGVTFIRLDFSGRAGFYMDLDFVKLCMKLHHSCPNVEALILAHCDISTNLPEVINSCTQFLESLKKLVLRYCYFKHYSGTEELKDNSNLEVLDLNWSHIPRSTKIKFSKLHSLKELRLASTIVGNVFFVGDTSFLNQLHVLDLQNTQIDFRIFLAIQRRGQNLKELYVCGLYLHDRAINFKNPVFPNLKTICFSNTSVICGGLVSLVRCCPSLVNVYVDEDVARSFAEHPLVVANRCKSGIVKSIDSLHNHDVDYSHS